MNLAYAFKIDGYMHTAGSAEPVHLFHQVLGAMAYVRELMDVVYTTWKEGDELRRCGEMQPWDKTIKKQSRRTQIWTPMSFV